MVVMTGAAPQPSAAAEEGAAVAGLRARILALESELAALRAQLRAPGPPAEPQIIYAATIVDASGPEAADFVYEQATPATEACFGRALRGVRATEIGLPPEGIAAGVGMIRHCDSTGQATAAEHEFPVPGRPPGWYFVTCTPLPRSAEGRARMSFTVTDIAWRRQAELALAESEARFRTLADCAPLLIWESDAAGGVTWVNRPWLDLTGGTLAQVLGDNWTDTVHPDDLQQVVAMFRDATARRAIYRMAYRLRAADGGWRMMREIGMPRFAPDGGFLGFIGSAVDETAAHAAQQELALSEEALRLAIESTDLGLWDFDLKTRQPLWSPRCRAMFGFGADAKLTEADFLACLHPNNRSHVAAVFARAIDPAIRADFDVEHRVIGPIDGVERWIAVKGRAVFDAAGQAVRAIGTARDITAHKHAEAALRDNAETLRLTAEVTQLGIWSLVIDTNTLIWSPRCKTVFGFGQDEAPDLARFWASVHPDDVAAVRAEFDSVFRPDSDGTYDVQCRLRDGGAERWISITGRTFFDASGRAVRAIGTALDITARKQAEAALRHATVELEARVAERTAQLAESEARLRAYFDTVEDTLFTIAVTADGRFLHEGFNPHGERRLGFDNNALRGRPVNAFMPPEIAEVIEESFVVVRDHGTRRFIRRLNFPGGEGVFDTLIMPVRDGAGRVVRLLGAAREVTEQVRLEEELRQTQKLQVIGQLTGGVAHDFNNLLTGISGSLELLVREISSPRGRRLLDVAQRSAARGARLTGQLLAFARRQRLEPQALDVNALVGGMAGLLTSTLGGAVRVETALAPDLAPALADATQLELAILNLAINARDAMPLGGIIVIATANAVMGPPQSAEDPPEGAHVLVAIRDGGSGMPPEVLARVFEPFFTTKEVGRGSGLGLPQVLGVAKQLGGGVRVESRAGEGTTVRLYLPRTDTATAADAPAALADAGGVLRGVRVLVVDDDAEVREVAASLLAELGCGVVLAGDAATALALLAAGETVDLALIDYAMPGMNGAETLAQLRARCPGLPAVMATGYADTQALAACDVPVIRKPYGGAELAAVLAPLVRSRRRAV